MKIFFNEFELYLAAFLLITMFILLNIQVFSRYLFQHSIAWTEELSTIFFIYIGYLGASAAVSKQQHLRIDIVLNLFKGTAKKVLLIITDLITMAFCIIIIPPFIDVINHLSKLHSTTLMLHLPSDWVYWVVPFSLLLMTIRFVQDIIRIIHAPAEEGPKVIGATIFDDIENEKSDGGI